MNNRLDAAAKGSESSNKCNDRTALILGGGGARAAYQVGVLKAIAEITPEDCNNPFPILCGTSAGSINTVALASNADNFQHGVERILGVWSQFKPAQVFKVNAFNLIKRISIWLWTHIGFGNWHSGPGSLLDNQPLRHLLHKYIDFSKIDKSIQNGDLYAYCLTACSYTSGESTTFFDGQDEIEPWKRTHRSGRREQMNIDHLMASSAIPVVFPSVKMGQEHFGDGSMRQISPLSPAVHLGANKILIIGLRMESQIGMHQPAQYRPSLGQIFGYVLDTLFLNSLYADVERLERLNRTLELNGSTKSQTSEESIRLIEHLIVSPSQDIADIAIKHYKRLPKAFRIALTFLGMNKGNSRRFISYLMFEETFCKELIDLGYQDAMRQRHELECFLEFNVEL